MNQLLSSFWQIFSPLVVLGLLFSALWVIFLCYCKSMISTLWFRRSDLDLLWTVQESKLFLVIHSKFVYVYESWLTEKIAKLKKRNPKKVSKVQKLIKIFLKCIFKNKVWFWRENLRKRCFTILGFHCKIHWQVYQKLYFRMCCDCAKLSVTCQICTFCALQKGGHWI